MDCMIRSLLKTSIPTRPIIWNMIAIAVAIALREERMKESLNSLIYFLMVIRRY